MSEIDLQKKVLKEKYLKDIAQELDVELKKKESQTNQSPSLRDIAFDKEGKIQFFTAGTLGESFQDSLVLIKYLAFELANTKAEMYLIKQKTELLFQSLSTSDKRNKATFIL